MEARRGIMNQVFHGSCKGLGSVLVPVEADFWNVAGWPAARAGRDHWRRES